MVPQHVAIIMDGNGRWAQARRRPRIYGHIHGSSRVRKIAKACSEKGVKFLTLYAFSSENWGRPSDEVQTLMKLLCKYLAREEKTLIKDNVKLNVIGQIDHLPQVVQKLIEKVMKSTAQNTGLCLTFALSYGSRQEILQATKKIAQNVKDGKLSVQEITQEIFSDSLQTQILPDPDLVIRTSGEYRISNFLLWQTAYSEFYFCQRLWPEFSVDDLNIAFDNYSKRQRRYGLLETPS